MAYMKRALIPVFLIAGLFLVFSPESVFINNNKASVARGSGDNDTSKIKSLSAEETAHLAIKAIEVLSGDVFINGQEEVEPGRIRYKITNFLRSCEVDLQQSDFRKNHPWEISRINCV